MQSRWLSLLGNVDRLNDLDLWKMLQKRPNRHLSPACENKRVSFIFVENLIEPMTPDSLYGIGFLSTPRCQEPIHLSQLFKLLSLLLNVEVWNRTHISEINSRFPEVAVLTCCHKVPFFVSTARTNWNDVVNMQHHLWRRPAAILACEPIPLEDLESRPCRNRFSLAQFQISTADFPEPITGRLRCLSRDPWQSAHHTRGHIRR